MCFGLFGDGFRSSLKAVAVYECRDDQTDWLATFQGDGWTET
jgi:hypothetical protein